MSTSPFNWVPPEWTTAKPDLKNDPNAQMPPLPSFKNPTKLDSAVLEPSQINRLPDLIAKTKFNNTHFSATRDLEDPEGTDTGSTLTEVSHPRSDFRHVDPLFKPKGLQSAIADLRSFKGIAGLDKEADDAFKEALPPLDDLDEMLSANPKGMQRLKLISDHILVRIITLFGEMNLALSGTGNQTAYTSVRAEYIDMLQDLDNREPKTVTPGKFGYGRVLQWFYVRPIIDKTDGKIKGAEVQAKWNPHISSSGIPIPHD